jgi:hypothetical protein
MGESMNLLEDYLRAVAILLPPDQREDIVAELRDMILTRLEALEADRGRPLSEAETEAALREVGHPLVVAARYRGGPQHVVGPALYPYWMFAVKLAVTIQAALAVIVFLARAFSGANMAAAFGDTVGSALTGAATLVGFATVAAWLIERYGVKIDYLDRWRVRDLKALDVAAWDLRGLGGRLSAAQAPARARRGWTGQGLVSRAVGAIASGALLILWWSGILRFPIVGNLSDLAYLGISPGPLADVDWIALWQAMLWPVIAYGVAIILQGALILARPGARRLRGAFDVAIGAVQIAAVAWFWQASPIAAAVRVDSVTAFAVRMKAAFGHGAPVPLAALITLTLVATAIGALAQMGRGAWDILERTPVKEGRATRPAPSGGLR